MTTLRERLHADQKEAKKVGRFGYLMRNLKRLPGEEVLALPSGSVYVRDSWTGTVRRAVPKVKGKAARKAERAARRAEWIEETAAERGRDSANLPDPVACLSGERAS